MTHDGRPQSVESALRERVKELTCLYGIARLAAKTDISLREVLARVGELVQRAWQYPEIAVVRISVDGESFESPGFAATAETQAAEVLVTNVVRGRVEVGYTEPRGKLDEGPFLKEERNLLDAVASHLASILERMDAEHGQSKLQTQLRHADRLATIGQLAAGVAHELNEPLGNILGFAQLLQKAPDLPEAIRADVDKITAASLRAREIIKRLLALARRSTPKMVRVNLSQLVDEQLQFFEARCARQGVTLDVVSSPGTPHISADPAQMAQVLVNLVVNAIQAMPGGGKLTVRVGAADEGVLLVVEDSGVGMNREVLDHLFVPFFTTKEVGQGTGLGLSTAHGIVTAHRGTVRVTSTPGQGSRFEIRLPRLQDESAPGERSAEVSAR